MDFYTEESRIRGTLRRTQSCFGGSVLLVKGNSTRLAQLGTRSVGSQASLEVETRSVGFQSSVFTTDLGTLQQWRSVQGAYRLESQGLQHRINFIIEETGKEPGAAERQSTDDLQSLHARIRSTTRDMDALDRSCSAESAVEFLRTGDQPSRQPCSFHSASRQAAPTQTTATPEKPAKKAWTSPTASPEKPVKNRRDSPRELIPTVAHR